MFLMYKLRNFELSTILWYRLSTYESMKGSVCASRRVYSKSCRSKILILTLLELYYICCCNPIRMVTRAIKILRIHLSNCRKWFFVTDIFKTVYILYILTYIFKTLFAISLNEERNVSVYYLKTIKQVLYRILWYLLSYILTYVNKICVK